tara:strand:- start:73 stop:303 length:231 start_codon:yes stop_codon:yes gene_type:complete
MNPTTAKQITAWRDELKTHKEKLEQAQLVVAQETRFITMIEGGIQFGEALLKKTVEEHLENTKDEQTNSEQQEVEA